VKPLSNIKLNQKTDRHLIEIDARTVVLALGLYDGFSELNMLVNCMRMYYELDK